MEKDDTFVSGRLKSLCSGDEQPQRCLQRAERKKMSWAGGGRGTLTQGRGFSFREQVCKRKSGCISQSEG